MVLQKGFKMTIVKGAETTFESLQEPPEEMTRPGISAQKTNNKISQILFIGGTKEK